MKSRSVSEVAAHFSAILERVRSGEKVTTKHVTTKHVTTKHVTTKHVTTKHKEKLAVTDIDACAAIVAYTGAPGRLADGVKSRT